MKVLLPDEGFSVSLPEDLHALACDRNLVHHSLWKEGKGRELDICLADHLSASDVIGFMFQNRCKTVMQVNPSWWAEDLRARLNLATDPMMFFQDPVRSILPEATKIVDWKFSSRTQKNKLRDEITREVSEVHRGSQESVNSVFEELFMNALLDAPRAALAANEESYGYEKRGHARLILGLESSRVCLACEDPYGSLAMDAFVGRMSRIYAEGAGKSLNMNPHAGGAGIGCVLMFESSSAMFVGVQPGKKTIVACVVPTQVRYRERDKIRKSLHLIEIE